MSFEALKLEIEGLILIKPDRYGDERGFFLESYKKSAFESMGIRESFVQENHSRSARGVLRGLHYQVHPFPQGKLLRVIQGEIFDVAVDIRKGSPYYGRWSGLALSGENHQILWIPPGFAHGFMAMTEGAEVLYSTTSEYAPLCERGIAWNDPAIGIKWPSLPPAVSEKDRKFPPLADAENTFVFGG
jgi:dTDP-4-dehydrorhamnose 3,5-epimerase